MKNSAICILLFTAISSISLFAMKGILWTMFNWGGWGAIILAILFTCTYAGGFFAVTKYWTGFNQYISPAGLKWIWVLGFLQLGVLGTLYHLLPQFFPAVIADFFFA